MSSKEFLKTIKDYRTDKQKLINDTYLWVSLAIKSFQSSIDEDKKAYRTKYRVPSQIKGKSILREPEDLKSILKSAKDKNLYQAAFVFIVSQFEAFLSDVISAYLKFDNRKLYKTISGKDSSKKIDVSEILKCADKEEIINLIIDKKLFDLFYAGPKIQTKYMEENFSFNIDESMWKNWYEYKATRDIVVHNSGLINSLYLEKTGDSARGSINEEIVIDKKYFENSLANIKSLIGKIESGIKKGLSKQSKSK